MDFTIIQADPSYAQALAKFCQPIYARTYPNAKYGMKPEHFSPEIFAHPTTIEYFAGILTPTSTKHTYLALDKHENIIGSLGIERVADAYELHAFYVALDQQGRGVGRKLMARALKLCTDDLPIRTEVGETVAAVNIYKHWGFRTAAELGVKLRHWTEWPVGLQNGYIFMEANKEDIRV